MCPKYANPAQLTRFDLKSLPCWPQTDTTSLRRRHAALASATTSFFLSNSLFYLPATGTKRTLFTQTFPPGHKWERYLKGTSGRNTLHHG